MRDAPPNRMAVAAVVLAIACWPLGIAFGHVAVRRARLSQGAGAGLAVVALIVAYTLALVTLLVIVVILGGTSTTLA